MPLVPYHHHLLARELHVGRMVAGGQGHHGHAAGHRIIQGKSRACRPSEAGQAKHQESHQPLHFFSPGSTLFTSAMKEPSARRVCTVCPGCAAATWLKVAPLAASLTMA